MIQILNSDWLLEQDRWCYLARLGLPAVFRKKKIIPKAIIVINPFIANLVRLRWLDIDLVLFCELMDLNSAGLGP